MAKKDRRVKYATDTEKPVMVSVRLPRELYDRLERYATQYRQPISELVKDGVEMRLEVEADPRSRKAGGTTEETELQIDGASILRDMQATLARHETQMEALMQAIERQTAPTGYGMSDSVSYDIIQGNTAREPAGQEQRAEQEPARAPIVKVDKEEVLARIQQMRDKGLDSAQIAETLQAEGVPTLSAEAQLQVVVDMLEHSAGEDSSEGNTRSTSPASIDTIPAVQPTVLQVAQSPALARVERQTFDPTRHHLGALCRNKHAWGSSGQSLRNADNQCLECRALAKREKDARKRAERKAQPVNG